MGVIDTQFKDDLSAPTLPSLSAHSYTLPNTEKEGPMKHPTCGVRAAAALLVGVFGCAHTTPRDSAMYTGFGIAGLGAVTMLASIGALKEPEPGEIKSSPMSGTEFLAVIGIGAGLLAVGAGISAIAFTMPSKTTGKAPEEVKLDGAPIPVADPVLVNCRELAQDVELIRQSLASVARPGENCAEDCTAFSKTLGGIITVDWYSARGVGSAESAYPKLVRAATSLEALARLVRAGKECPFECDSDGLRSRNKLGDELAAALAVISDTCKTY